MHEKKLLKEKSAECISSGYQRAEVMREKHIFKLWEMA